MANEYITPQAMPYNTPYGDVNLTDATALGRLQANIQDRLQAEQMALLQSQHDYEMKKLAYEQEQQVEQQKRIDEYNAAQQAAAQQAAVQQAAAQQQSLTSNVYKGSADKYEPDYASKYYTDGNGNAQFNWANIRKDYQVDDMPLGQRIKLAEDMLAPYAQAHGMDDATKKGIMDIVTKAENKKFDAMDNGIFNTFAGFPAGLVSGVHTVSAAMTGDTARFAGNTANSMEQNLSKAAGAEADTSGPIKRFIAPTQIDRAISTYNHAINSFPSLKALPANATVEQVRAAIDNLRAKEKEYSAKSAASNDISMRQATYKNMAGDPSQESQVDKHDRLDAVDHPYTAALRNPIYTAIGMAPQVVTLAAAALTRNPTLVGLSMGTNAVAAQGTAAANVASADIESLKKSDYWETAIKAAGGDEQQARNIMIARSAAPGAASAAALAFDKATAGLDKYIQPVAGEALMGAARTALAKAGVENADSIIAKAVVDAGGTVTAKTLNNALREAGVDDIARKTVLATAAAKLTATTAIDSAGMAGSQLAGNVASQEYNPDQSAWAGVGEAAAMGALAHAVGKGGRKAWDSLTTPKKIDLTGQDIYTPSPETEVSPTPAPKADEQFVGTYDDAAKMPPEIRDRIVANADITPMRDPDVLSPIQAHRLFKYLPDMTDEHALNSMKGREAEAFIKQKIVEDMATLSDPNKTLTMSVKDVNAVMGGVKAYEKALKGIADVRTLNEKVSIGSIEQAARVQAFLNIAKNFPNNEIITSHTGAPIPAMQSALDSYLAREITTPQDKIKFASAVETPAVTGMIYAKAGFNPYDLGAAQRETPQSGYTPSSVVDTPQPVHAIDAPAPRTTPEQRYALENALGSKYVTDKLSAAVAAETARTSVVERSPVDVAVNKLYSEHNTNRQLDQIILNERFAEGVRQYKPERVTTVAQDMTTDALLSRPTATPDEMLSEVALRSPSAAEYIQKNASDVGAAARMALERLRAPDRAVEDLAEAIRLDESTRETVSAINSSFDGKRNPLGFALLSKANKDINTYTESLGKTGPQRGKKIQFAIAKDINGSSLPADAKRRILDVTHLVLKQLPEDVKVVAVTDAEYAGKYNPANRTIYINSHVKDPHHVLVHEALHAVLVDRLDVNSASSKPIVDLLNAPEVKSVIGKYLNPDDLSDTRRYVHEAVQVLVAPNAAPLRAALARVKVDKLSSVSALKRWWIAATNVLKGKYETATALDHLYKYVLDIGAWKPANSDVEGELYARANKQKDAPFNGKDFFYGLNRETPDDRQSRAYGIRDEVTGKWDVNYKDKAGNEVDMQFDNYEEATSYLAGQDFVRFVSAKNSKGTIEPPTIQATMNNIVAKTPIGRAVIKAYKSFGMDATAQLYAYTDTVTDLNQGWAALAKRSWGEFYAASGIRGAVGRFWSGAGDRLSPIGRTGSADKGAVSLRRTQNKLNGMLASAGGTEVSFVDIENSYINATRNLGVPHDEAMMFAYSQAVPGHAAAMKANLMGKDWEQEVSRRLGSGFEYGINGKKVPRKVLPPDASLEDTLAAEAEYVNGFLAHLGPEKVAKLEALMKPLWDYNQMIQDMRHDVGLIDAETRELYRKNYRYMPLKNEDSNLRQRNKTTGRSSMAYDPIAMLVSQMKTQVTQIKDRVLHMKLLEDVQSGSKDWAIVHQEESLNGGRLRHPISGKVISGENVISVTREGVEYKLVPLSGEAKALANELKGNRMMTGSIIGDYGIVTNIARVLTRVMATGVATTSATFQAAATTIELGTAAANIQGGVGRYADGTWIVKTKDAPKFYADSIITAAQHITPTLLHRVVLQEGGIVSYLDHMLPVDVHNRFARKIEGSSLLKGDFNKAGVAGTLDTTKDVLRGALSAPHAIGSAMRVGVWNTTVKHITGLDPSAMTHAQLKAFLRDPANKQTLDYASRAARDVQGDFSRVGANEKLRAGYMFMAIGLMGIRLTNSVLMSPYGRMFTAALMAAQIYSASKMDDEMGNDPDGTPKYLRMRRMENVVGLGDTTGVPIPYELRAVSGLALNMYGVYKHYATDNKKYPSLTQGIVNTISVIAKNASPIQYQDTGTSGPQDILRGIAPDIIGSVLQPIITDKDNFGNSTKATTVYDKNGHVIPNAPDYVSGRTSDSEAAKQIAKWAHVLTTGADGTEHFYTLDMQPYTVDLIAGTVAGRNLSMLTKIMDGKSDFTTELFKGYTTTYDPYAIKEALKDAESKSTSKRVLVDVREELGLSTDMLDTDRLAREQKLMSSRNRDGLSKLIRAKAAARLRGDSAAVEMYNAQIDALYANRREHDANLLEQLEEEEQ